MILPSPSSVFSGLSLRTEASGSSSSGIQTFLFVLVGIIVFPSATVAGGSGGFGDEQIVEKRGRMQYQVYRHESCRRMTQQYVTVQNGGLRWIHEKDSNQVVELPDYPGCYTTTGWIDINFPGGMDLRRNNLQVYLEVRFNLSIQAPPEPCHRNVSIDGEGTCGGHGSCVYCENCDSAKARLDKVNEKVVFLRRNSSVIKCDTGIRNGLHKDLTLGFCLPTHKEFIEAAGISTNTLLSLPQSNKFPMLLKVHLYQRGKNVLNRPVDWSKKSQSQKGRKTNQHTGNNGNNNNGKSLRSRGGSGGRRGSGGRQDGGSGSVTIIRKKNGKRSRRNRKRKNNRRGGPRSRHPSQNDNDQDKIELFVNMENLWLKQQREEQEFKENFGRDPTWQEKQEMSFHRNKLRYAIGCHKISGNLIINSDDSDENGADGGNGEIII